MASLQFPPQKPVAVRLHVPQIQSNKNSLAITTSSLV